MSFESLNDGYQSVKKNETTLNISDTGYLL